MLMINILFVLFLFLSFHILSVAFTRKYIFFLKKQEHSFCLVIHYNTEIQIVSLTFIITKLIIVC